MCPIDYQNSGLIKFFLGGGDFTHTHDQSYSDVTIRNRLMSVAMKAMPTASKHNVLPDSAPSDV